MASASARPVQRPDAHPGAQDSAPSTWTPNQQAARNRIITASAELIAQEGLSACTFRAVAERSGITKSTVHYYFDDANELVDLSVGEIMRRIAEYAIGRIEHMSDPTAGIPFLVRLFMSRDRTPPGLMFRDSMLWPAYTTHAWGRGAKGQIVERLDTLRAVFQVALEKAGVGPAEVQERAGSIHHYLLGAMIRNMAEPIDRGEVARAVSALSGVMVDPRRC